MKRAKRDRRAASGPPVWTFSREAVRKVDECCAEEFGLPTIVLMENAAAHLAAVVLSEATRSAGGSVLIVCGPGNNGGDGLAAARHLHNAGVRVAAVMSHPPAGLRGDARVQLGVCVRMGIDMVRADPGEPEVALAAVARRLGGTGVVIDALLGTGLNRPIPVDSVFARLIGGVNALRTRGWRVVAADIPSGMDADTGRPVCQAPRGGRTAVIADMTVTFTGLKNGFRRVGAAPYLGTVLVAETGAPAELIRRLGTRARAGR
ncbi:MAG: NAD(P)H-hydrate epimerase [Phycisphaerales bacterium]